MDTISNGEPTEEERRRLSLKANLRDRLAERLEDDVRRLLDEADPSLLDTRDATEIVHQTAQIVAHNLRRG